MALATIFLLAPAGDSVAGTAAAAGYVFSDELGGFRLLSATGAGTDDDPIVLVEEITGPGAAILVVRQGNPGQQLEASDANRPYLRIAMVKIAINRTGYQWSGFDVELRPAPDLTSDYLDGLSFDQIRATEDSASSDRFARARRIYEPRDLVRFEDGVVGIDEASRFAFRVTDVTPEPVFYIAQSPIVLVARRTNPRGIGQQLATIAKTGAHRRSSAASQPYAVSDRPSAVSTPPAPTD